MRIEEIFRAEHGRIPATLIRVLVDFDVAEDALQEAFAAALEQWPVGGTPANPVAWLVATARHKAIDRLRRQVRLAQKQEEIARHLELSVGEEDATVPEDRLRLIFTCCHPALATEAQVALTLRTLGGLSTARTPSWCPRRPWRSGSCAPRPRSAPRAFPTRCRPRRRSPSGSRR
jgi:RNA polymerase sigma-70 factor (ECF subfamily)